MESPRFRRRCAHRRPRSGRQCPSPDRFSGFRVEREQERPRSCVDDAVGIRDAAITEDIALPPAAADEIRHVVRPQQMSIHCIDGVDTSTRIGHVHHAVNDDRRRLIAHTVDDPVLKEPARREQLDVLRVDLVQRRKSAASQIEVVERPVDRRRRSRPLRFDSRRESGRHECGGQSDNTQDGQWPFPRHNPAPLITNSQFPILNS